MSAPLVIFVISGAPVPKQSFRTTRQGGGYRDPRVTAWQDTVARQATDAMQGEPPLSGALSVRLEFTLPDRRRRDLDNLSKGVLDACNGICWHDDRQVVHLEISKRVGGEPGVAVWIEKAA